MASALRARGYTTLEQLLPPSKLEHLLGEAGAGADETRAAVSLARELRSSQGMDGDGGGGGGGGGQDIFSPLSTFSRRGLLAGPRGSPDSRGGARGGQGGESSRGSSRGTASRGSGRPGTRGGMGSRETRRKKRPLRISLGGLECEGGGVGGRVEGGEFDPSRYTSRPEEWRRPPPSVIKKRWDSKAKASSRVLDGGSHGPATQSFAPPQTCALNRRARNLFKPWSTSTCDKRDSVASHVPLVLLFRLPTRTHPLVPFTHPETDLRAHQQLLVRRTLPETPPARPVRRRRRPPPP